MGGSVGVSSPPVGRPRAAQWGGGGGPVGASRDPLGGPTGAAGGPQWGLRHLRCPSHLVGLTFLRYSYLGCNLSVFVEL